MEDYEMKKMKKIIQENTEVIIKQKRFRHKKTGEIVTQIPILEFSDYEEVKECN